MNELTEVKTVDLIGPALDWAVAKAAGWVLARIVAIETPSKTYYEIHARQGWSYAHPATGLRAAR